MSRILLHFKRLLRHCATNSAAELARESATSTERLAQLNSAHARSLAERKEKQEELAHTKGTLEAAMARHAELAEELEEVKNALAVSGEGGRE